ncbi:MAG: dTDP-4-dehydrorhamnose 3,5-epimerase [Acidimicrobiales bacterium]
MKFLETPLSGCFVIEPEPVSDDRGFFARTFAAGDFERLGLDPAVIESSVSYNTRRGTVRGLHLQAAPYGETKLVRCTRGRILDVAVDLRPDSPTHLQWTSAELTADNRRSLYLPKQFAHGFMTIEDDTEVVYQMSSPYVAEAASGLRWDDPVLAIAWPDAGTITISARDRAWPLLDRSDVSDRAR